MYIYLFIHVTIYKKNIVEIYINRNIWYEA